jgi:Zn-finger nucleic acid-binding protein
MADRAGIEIDYCPTCRGVWLERGELDKVIERSAVSMPGAPPAPSSSGSARHDDRPSYRHGGDYHGKRKRKSFLSEMFEFE